MMPSDDFKPADEQAANDDDDDLKTADEDEEGEEDSHEHYNRSIYMIDVDEKNIDPADLKKRNDSAASFYVLEELAEVRVYATEEGACKLQVMLSEPMPDHKMSYSKDSQWAATAEFNESAISVYVFDTINAPDEEE